MDFIWDIHAYRKLTVPIFESMISLDIVGNMVRFVFITFDLTVSLDIVGDVGRFLFIT